jgi:conjugal transfer/entry exclusion protein
MATPKQVRRVMKKIYYYQDKLQDALNEAHNMDVIKYNHDEEGSYNKYAPCSPAYECRERVRKTTEAALAEAMRTEIKRTIK